jgi:hypothetical protein
MMFLYVAVILLILAMFSRQILTVALTVAIFPFALMKDILMACKNPNKFKGSKYILTGMLVISACLILSNS